jgi:hypothetical protein
MYIMYIYMTNISNEFVNKQNVNLSYQLRKIKDKYSTDDQKNYYERQKISDAKYFFNVLFVVYYIFLIVLLYFLYQSTKYSNYMKIGLVVLLGIYPFIVSTIEFFLFEAIYYIYALIFSIPYKSKVFG